jgi:hypothetical protein
MRTDGSEKQELFIGDASSFYGQAPEYNSDYGLFNVSENWIYYAAGNEIYKIRTDGSDKQLLGNETDNFHQINVSGDYIYYLTFDPDYDFPTASCRLKTDGSGKEIIKLGECGVDINVVGDWIYYEKPYGIGIFKIRTNGTEDQAVRGGQ